MTVWNPVSAEKKWEGKWLRDPAFAAYAPRDLYHKEQTPFAIEPHDPQLQDHHMLARKSFCLAALPEEAYLDITADDFYRVYLNGSFLAEGPASSYPFRYRYDRIDLRGLLRKGENTLAVLVYYQGLINRVWVSADYRQGLLAEIRSGETVLAATDESWKVCYPRRAPGARFGYDTQFAENIDAASWIATAWREPEFCDADWQPATVNSADDHILVRSEIPVLTNTLQEPVAITTLPGGRTLYDFGTEVVGYFTCTASGPRGSGLRIRHGEELQEDGTVRALRCNCDYTELWTLSGTGEDRLEYTDYKAFRYVELQPEAGAESAIKVMHPQVRVRHYPLDARAAKFQSADNDLQGIWEICARAVTLGAQTVFVDCPSREKGQYLGDMTVTGNAHLYVAGDARLFGKALLDFADSTRICPGMMAVSASSFMQEIADYSLQYPLQVLAYYQYTGNHAMLQTLLPVAEGIMAHFRQFRRTDGLLENVRDKWNLVDWPDNLRDSYDFKLDPKDVGPGAHAVLNAFYAIALQAMDALRQAAGQPTTDEARTLKDAFQKAFFRADTGLFADSETSTHSALHPNALALYAGLVPQEAQTKIVDFLMQKGLCCGVYLSFFVLKALARAGRPDLAYQLLCNDSERSWKNMLREGATTCFEAWGKDQKWNTSLCHPWAAAPIPVLVEDLIGLTPAEPGYRSIRFAPRLATVQTDCNLTLHVPTATLHLHKQGGELLLRVCTGEQPVTLRTDAPVQAVAPAPSGETVFTIPARTERTLQLTLR